MGEQDDTFRPNELDKFLGCFERLEVFAIIKTPDERDGNAGFFEGVGFTIGGSDRTSECYFLFPFFLDFLVGGCSTRMARPLMNDPASRSFISLSAL